MTASKSGVPTPPLPLPGSRRRPWLLIAALGAAVVLFLMLAASGDAPFAVRSASGDTVSNATPAPDAPSGAVAPAGPTTGRAKRKLVTLRGEIVDYYCYIEKGWRGKDHKECGTRCVAGDICMGLLTDDDRLFMISINHMRAMEPLQFEGIPDPFTKCRGMITERVEMTGYTMERHWQRVIEVTAVKAIPAS